MGTMRGDAPRRGDIQPGRQHLQEPSLVSGATSAGCALW